MFACALYPSDEAFLTEIQGEVAETVAPGQDTSDLRVDARDGCLMYRHVGPVETTYIPLRTKKGRPICIKQDA